MKRLHLFLMLSTLVCGLNTLPSSKAVAQQKSAAVSTEQESIDRLAKGLEPWINALQLRSKAFSVQGELAVPVDGKSQRVRLVLNRIDDDSFVLKLTHESYALEFVRTKEFTALVLPLHKKVFWGKGGVDSRDHLAPTDVFKRLVSSGSVVQIGADILGKGQSADVANALVFLAKAAWQPKNQSWELPGEISLKFSNEAKSAGESASQLNVAVKGLSSQVSLSQSAAPASFISGLEPSSKWVASHWPGFAEQELPRDEIERSLSRGVRRAFEVLAPSPRLTSPKMVDKSVPHGKLKWVEGQRVVLLSGTPEEIGKAHGELLHDEAMRCIDSVLYSFGTAQTIATGRWFREELELAYERLAPHIPERHKVETRALAASLNLNTRLVETINVFPELFHCSGFAVFGSATVDGKLYHGRVLDYMTEIGLQDAATTFVIAPEGKIAFANVGYGGFIGSVSGMNTAQISLGEMGGKGEGKWDGVPMATLMRRALEECSTLDEVKELWRTSPRTCEYYYVFADGKTRQAVGVAATPESVQFVGPGEGHALLGEGIPDAVVLSAGSRLEALRSRVKESHGRIDATIGQQLMCRPVAMKSNLHNVLFVPEDGVLYVANADHKHPAAERPYVRFDLKQLIIESSTVNRLGTR